MSQLQTKQVGDWTFQEIKLGLWKAFLNDKALIMTGAAVTKDIRIPTFHTFERIELTQNTTADVASVDSFDISLIKKLFSDAEVAQHRVTIWSKSGLIVSDYGVNFDKDNFEREPSTYTLSITGTATNKFYPVLYFLEGTF
jgi:hypothetical protein